MQATVNKAIADAKQAAALATNAFLEKHGDADACGFSWITVYERGNTKLGRALLKGGFTKEYEGGLQLWNPSSSYTQSITAKEVGSTAAAKVISEQLGITCYAGSRMD